MEQHPQGHLGADALENSEQLLKAALDDNRRRRAIKNMALPIMWTQEDLYEKKFSSLGCASAVFKCLSRNSYPPAAKCKQDNVVLLVSSVVPGGGSSFCF